MVGEFMPLLEVDHSFYNCNTYRGAALCQTLVICHHFVIANFNFTAVRIEYLRGNKKEEIYFQLGARLSPGR
jgi:hypothetical protein